MVKSVRRRGIGSIIGSRFVPNARRIRWTILRIKHKVPFFHDKFSIFDEKQRKLICTPDIYIILPIWPASTVMTSRSWTGLYVICSPRICIILGRWILNLRTSLFLFGWGSPDTQKTIVQSTYWSGNYVYSTSQFLTSLLKKFFLHKFQYQLQSFLHKLITHFPIQRAITMDISVLFYNDR